MDKQSAVPPVHGGDRPIYRIPDLVFDEAHQGFPFVYTPLGFYMIGIAYDEADASRWRLLIPSPRLGNGCTLLSVFDTLEEAKAAANADYRRRLSEHLEPVKPNE